MSAKWARGPRKAQPAPPSQTFYLLREIIDDPRFAELGAPAQSILLAAVVKRADRSGMFFEKAGGLGRLVGRNERNVRPALEEAVKSGLLTKQPYLRLNNTRGSNIYRVDEHLVISADETIRAYSERKKPPAVEAPRADEIVLADKRGRNHPSEQARTKPSEQDVGLDVEDLDALEASESSESSSRAALDEDEKDRSGRCRTDDCNLEHAPDSPFCVECLELGAGRVLQFKPKAVGL